MEMQISTSSDGRAVTLVGPEGQKLRVRFFYAPKGSKMGKVRFRLYDAGPMYIKEAHLSGRGKHVVVSVIPEGYAPAVNETEHDE